MEPERHHLQTVKLPNFSQILIPDEERKNIARLFNLLAQGEHIAMNCAARQAELADPVSRRFFLNQAKQELFHAKAFKAGIAILAPRGVGEPIGEKAMTQYGQLINSALDRGDLLESLLGMQIILEGLGDVALNRMSHAIPDEGAVFRHVYRLIVGQEDAHHRFGLRQFQRHVESKDGVPEHIYQHGEHYLELINDILFSVQPLLEYFDEESQDFLDELLQIVPRRDSVNL